MKYTDLKEKSTEELNILLKDKKHEMFNLKVQQKLMQLTKTSELRSAKKDIARINTALAAQA